jgi:hypothetical protein
VKGVNQIVLFIGLTGLLLAALGALAPVQALDGYYTEEEVRSYDQVTGRDKVVTRKTWYAGDRWRKEEVYYGTTIARFDLDRIYVLDPNAKTCLEITPKFLQTYASEGLSAFGRYLGDGKFDFPNDLYIRTETTKQIGHWDCYQVMTNPVYRTPKSSYAVFWYCADVDFPVKIYGDQLRRVFGESREVEALFDRLTKFEGYPVRTEAHIPNANQTTTLIKVENRKDIDPALFEVPEEYVKVPFSPESAQPLEEQ